MAYPIKWVPPESARGHLWPLPFTNYVNNWQTLESSLDCPESGRDCNTVTVFDFAWKPKEIWTSLNCLSRFWRQYSPSFSINGNLYECAELSLTLFKSQFSLLCFSVCRWFNDCIGYNVSSDGADQYHSTQKKTSILVKSTWIFQTSIRWLFIFLKFHR